MRRATAALLALIAWCTMGAGVWGDQGAGVDFDAILRLVASQGSEISRLNAVVSAQAEALAALTDRVAEHQRYFSQGDFRQASRPPLGVASSEAPKLPSQRGLVGSGGGGAIGRTTINDLLVRAPTMVTSQLNVTGDLYVGGSIFYRGVIIATAPTPAPSLPPTPLPTADPTVEPTACSSRYFTSGSGTWAACRYGNGNRLHVLHAVGV